MSAVEGCPLSGVPLYTSPGHMCTCVNVVVNDGHMHERLLIRATILFVLCVLHFVSYSILCKILQILCKNLAVILQELGLCYKKVCPKLY